MASDTESPTVAAEPMELSTPFKEAQTEAEAEAEAEAGTADTQTITPTPTPRKRGRPPKVKTDASPSANTSVQTPLKTPTKSNARGKTKPKTTAASSPSTGMSPEAEAEANADEDLDSEASPSKKSRKAAPSTGSATKKVMGPIPTSFEAAGESDRLILRMRDEGSSGWAEINAAWTKMTGISVGKTTLRMRYSTMKSNFVCVAVEDEPRLLNAKREVEERFETDKWIRIAEVLEATGGKKYPANSLQKKFKQMASKTGSAITTNATTTSTTANGTGNTAAATASPSTTATANATTKTNTKPKPKPEADAATRPSEPTDTADTPGSGPGTSTDPVGHTLVTELDGVNIYDEDA